MLTNINPLTILFLDIETVPLAGSWNDLDEETKLLWQYRTNRFKQLQEEEMSDDEYYFKKSGVYAEFGKVICISIGIFRFENKENETLTLRLKSFYGHNEAEILKPFFDLLSKSFSAEHFYLCGHNIREFDVPFLCRRAIVNSLSLPDILNVHTFKPWEQRLIDTMQLWKFGDYKNFTSLNLLTHILDIPSPKTEMDGSMVADIYWNEETGLEKIKNYCLNDVVALAQVWLRFHKKPLIKPEHIVYG
ncbi:MAG: ribonuclease H-like domain-containing protein [Sphingobacteriales bacterium]|nr:MAG: ribonuclease H-like domain-containing protein [Sphingobacteriales bacterium]